MKKITFLVAGLLFAGSLAYASETNFSDNNNRYYNGPVDYRNAEPVVFMERGIEFMVFPNGEMDFNTELSANNGDNYYRNRSRATANATYGAPRYTPSGGVRVEHDYNGRVRRVGNVFINYDALGRIKRIGSVYMGYNSFALTQIGGMKIVYDRTGRIVRTMGYINGYNAGYVYEPYAGGYGNNYNNGGSYNGGGNSYGNNAEDYYYYKKDGTKAKMTEADIKEIKIEEGSK